MLLEDYRDLTGTYDKLVSIEMIEAVGWQYFPTYFRRCSELLRRRRRDAAAGDHDRRPRLPRREGGQELHQHLHLPGGCLPSMEVISRSLARVTDLRQVHLEDITAHYATTLAALARALPRPPPIASPSSATTSASAACGSYTWATARAASASGASRTCSCCWPSPATAPSRAPVVSVAVGSPA